MDDERTAKLRADFESMYAPDDLVRFENGEYMFLSARLQWIGWQRCAEFYKVGE